MSKRRNRKHGVIDKLAPEMKDTVDQLLLSGNTYSEIVEYLAKNDVALSQASVCRYAQAFHADVQMLNIAQENFRRMMDEMNRYPNLDTTEAIIRLASQNVFSALANTPEEEWKTLDPTKLLREANGLIKAAAYKNRFDLQNKAETDIGFDAVKSLVFEAMAKERPELYRQVTSFLEGKQREGQKK